ncbi:hypothetical protein H112_05822 [Trichophyton rubrum D6]|uniref:Poly A polymerase head domain-containing protein n=2 Tax=Trichophyton TaxID=5550 RepID=A0A022VXS9_TRIRU|nr:hypothetical protein H100_05836 [Trichophyton rubrum MR850]EZF40109.1 hypothetical protein H102_05805 [Trichophyton rubrum CBS 100081]EZF50734.1 hypothetical protein H103_05833 [Trichophyton rubrum CBS 288.86]EZF61339.1 hypothetical protein H104_05819 [Trichophyton rubrum CBS 289.86]EZF71992.1 hypothetical protein H105_05846 [Trichophyton soudanense CBS 452.61]EZF82646.1 hypothetical protein H110_05827 [Trichophyton rubrum MR1448]EZF93348.1 hypothetical protein H113_05874 [Trichophyton rub
MKDLRILFYNVYLLLFFFIFYSRATIKELQEKFPEFSNTYTIVIGDLSVWKHLPKGRRTADVDLLTSIPGAPQIVKQKLLGVPGTPFTQQSQYFLWRHPEGKNIQVDFPPSWQFPFLPSGALRLGQDRLPDLPHATPEDLLALKINSSGLRATIEKRTVDAADADALAEMLLGRGPIVLTAEEPSIIFLSEAERITLLRGAGSTYNAR